MKADYSAWLGELINEISLIEGMTLRSLLTRRFKNETESIRNRHNKKLFNLWFKQSKMSPDCITDISSRGLSIHERNALQFGLNHHVLPKSFDKDLVIVNIKQMVDTVTWRTKSKVDFDLRDDIKRCYFEFEQQGKKICATKKNVYMHRTLRNLASDKRVKICSYDKGTGLVVMDSCVYYEKLSEILQDDSKFQKIDVDHSKPSSHPIVVKQRSLNNYIRRYFPEEDRKRLMESGTQPGKLYGLCKVHKDNYPMRPVVSMINTPEYNLSKYLDAYIKPNIPKRYMLNSTNEFLDKINEFSLNGNEYMVSFDVVSLFTNVPLIETIDIVTNLVYGKDSVAKPPFNKDIFRKLLLKCSQSFFMFNDVLYQQTDGVSMGGPLAPSMANAFLSHLECKLLSDSFKCKPELFLRYVDDIFALFYSYDDALEFLDILNNLHKSVKFTIEKGNKCMPFLDVSVSIINNYFVTSVYRKATHTGVFLNYTSKAPTAWKRGVILCLLHRAKMICSTVSNFNVEVDNLRKMFISNSYPVSFFNNVLNLFNTDRSSSISDSEEEIPTVVFNVPYLGKCSRSFSSCISRLIHDKFDVKVRVVYSTFKVRSYFRLKCFSPFYLSSNVVYQFNCLNASSTDTYIGYTRRHLYERTTEHLNMKAKNQSE